MRRGHNVIGGWRNENPRHYRPRNGGNPHFRPPRSYGLLDPPRFPPPSSRSGRQQFYARSEKPDQSASEHGDRNRYRLNRYSGYHRTHQHTERHIPPVQQQGRQSSNNHKNTYKDAQNFYKDVSTDNFHINSMGDVDHRQIPQMRDSFVKPYPHPWQIESNVQQNVYKNQGIESDEVTKLSADYTGHRPPASDHFGNNPNNSVSFSRSVNDTVDLIRKRLLNRNEQQATSENFENNQNRDMLQNNHSQGEKTSILPKPLNQQESPTKKYQRHQHNDKSNCAKIKNKIVHQLFKMDKDKIHKLMDNPNSSDKFEYAISSLITESQNSYNRHLRSAAEKSLCSSSADFMQNDNNTIYEDTFMKQMQCILDPQDTILLEDIKPIVMAELSKVLQIGEFEDQHYNVVETDNSYSAHNEHNFDHSSNNEYSYEDYNHENVEYMKPETSESKYIPYDENQDPYKKTNPFFERKSRRKSYSYSEEACTSSENSFYNKSATDTCDDERRPQASQQLFNTSSEYFSEEDDPFAELDKQYHVAVDPDFIEQDDISDHTQVADTHNKNFVTIKMESDTYSPEKKSNSNTESLSSQTQGVNNSSNALNRSCESFNERKDDDNLLSKIESFTKDLRGQDNNCNPVTSTNESKDEKTESQSKEMMKENEKSLNIAPMFKTATTSNSRKRSTDQRPSHRKEKRKKVDLCQTESNKQILNKNIIINVNDCASKSSDNCETPKSIFNLFFSKEENKPISKENKKVGSNDKNYTEKHVKRKETSKKENEKKPKTRKDSTSNQITSSSDNNLSSNSQGQTKTESKITLKTIDMFTEQPRKINVHHAHRNTSQTPTVACATRVATKTKIGNTPKTKGTLSQPLLKRHVAVQVIRKVHVKETQTETKKFAVKAIQTDAIVPERLGLKATDAFERMKEIDLEIQGLLQEKFKLYNSIETKDSVTNALQTLGMTVLNVNNFNEEGNAPMQDVLSEDVIVDEFANIPVEELEQIALETVQEEQVETPKMEKRSKRRKVSYQDSVKSESPTTVTKRKSRKVKSPNISLIEQIITDDRPLEDIISLDDLEAPQTTRSKAKKTRKTAKARGVGKAKTVKSAAPQIELKECSVVLIRTDISNYVQLLQTQESEVAPKKIVEEYNEVYGEEMSQPEIVQIEDNIIESVANHMQFDMLDVSEDIVVGDNCEVKSLDDKEIAETLSIPISEEIILDNSQSSTEDVTAPAACEGGECIMYDYSADENLRRDSVVVTGNGDAVLAIECVENNFLAACLDGNVYYFSQEGQLITTLRGSNLAVTCLTIVKEKYGTTVYTGSLDSRIRYYDLETGLEKGPECNVLSPIQTMDRAWDTVFVGTRTGFVLQFECKNNMLIPVSSVKFSDQSILALRAMKEGPRKVLLVAARSENVTIKDAQTGLLLRTLYGPKMTVYSLLYEDGKVYCGTSSHQIHVFDYTSGSHVGTHEGGKGAVCLRASGGLVFAGCYDGCVYVYREGEARPFAHVRGPSLMLLSLAVVGGKIIAGYKDRSLYIWKIPLSILQEMIL